MSDLSSLVSVIIPVYNSKAHLEACVHSVVNQTYSCIEIIIVDDGSTDGSAGIIDGLTCLDERIFTIHKLNEGPALARKQGAERASGKYIQFLDSDDTLLDNAIELLVEKAETTGADIVALPFFLCESITSKTISVKLEFSELNGIEYFNEILNNRGYWSVWSNFQKRSLFQECYMDIVPGIFFGEDAIWMTQILLSNPKVVSMDKPLLNYSINPSSLTNRGDLMADRNKSFRGFQVWMENYIEKKGLTTYFKKGLALQHLQTTFTSIRWRQLGDVEEDMKRIIFDLKQFPDLKEKLSRRECKMIFFYRIATFMGQYYLMDCMKKGKM